MCSDNVWKINMADEWINGAYDEDGDETYCDLCGSNLYYDGGDYICRTCGATMSRADFFNHIGAEPLSDKCLTCWENYPMCKENCYQ